MDSRVITREPDGSCYRACRRAISMIQGPHIVGIYKASTYVYRARVIKSKKNTVIVDRCYRKYYKEQFNDKWQLIGNLPINPELKFEA